MLRTPPQPRPQSLDDLLDSALIAHIDRLDLASRRVFTGKLRGERRSKRRGQSVEFADHRQYGEGDDIRHIDWNIYGRLDRLFVKLFLEEEDLALHLVLDCSESHDTGQPGKFLFMQKAAMALGYVGLVNLNRVAATAMGPREGSIWSAIRDLRGRRRLHELAQWICSLQPRGAFSFRQAAQRIALARRGRGVMVLFSDCFFKEGFEAGLKLLVGRGFDLFVVQVLSPQEVNPPLTGDLRLKDVEDADQAEVTISAPLLKRYKANLAAYAAELGLFCARREINLITVQSDLPVETLLLDFMRKRGLLT
ncbi:MAG: DUF58 domain-containing protein [Phycisphaerae bacterium]|nr:DUF58 domain-containing protein [Phycisphaerae bacterium]